MQAPVVRGENDDRPVRQFQGFEPGEQPSHRVVQRLDHAGIDRLEGRGIVPDPQRLRRIRDVRGVVGQVDQEGAVAVVFDESFGGGGQIVFALAAFGCRGLGIRLARMIEVEAVLPRAEALAADVPLAERAADVAGLLEVLRQHHLFQRHLHLDLGVQNLLGDAVGAAGQKGGQVQAGWGLAREDRRPRRRADRLGAVGGGETHAFLCETIQAGRVVVMPPVTVQIVDAQIVAKNENDVRPLPSRLVLAAGRTARVALDATHENRCEHREKNRSHDFHLRSGRARRMFRDYGVVTSGLQASHIAAATSTLRPAPMPCVWSFCNSYIFP